MRSVFIPVAIGCVAASLLVSVPSAAGVTELIPYDDPLESNQQTQFVGEVEETQATTHNQGRNLISPNGGLVTAHWPHPSNGVAEVSGHVCWKPVGNPSFSTMRLTAQLYAWYGNRYVKVGMEDARESKPCLKGQTPGPNARVACVTGKTTSWHTFGTGYAPGVQKSYGEHKSDNRDISCWPWTIQ